jgi:hypothetical protein
VIDVVLRRRSRAEPDVDVGEPSRV